MTQALDILVERLLVNPQQPRTTFDDAELKVLAQSIQEHGIIQALAVEDAGDGWYIVHDGERRLRSAKLAGLATVPCVVSPPLDGEVADKNRLLRALIANDQRVSLNPIEQAQAYNVLRQNGMMVWEIAKSTGRSTTFVSDRLKLLTLDEEIQKLVARRLLPLDSKMVEAFLSIPQETRIKLAQRLARPRQGITAVVTACERARVRLEQHERAQDRRNDEKVPAFVAGGRRPRTSNETVRWPNVRSAVQGTCDHCDANPRNPQIPEPAWALIVKASEGTCEQCSIRPRQREEVLSVCKACPMVELLRKLTAADGVKA